LLGLDFLSVKSSDGRASSAASADTLLTPRNSAHTQAFEPSSTQRAKKRAEFEAQNKLNQERRKSVEIEEREKRVRELQKELQALREVI